MHFALGMPVDYSKFDRIEDSDEEPAAKPPVAKTQDAIRKADVARRGGYPGSARETLEPMGLDASLRVCGSAPPDMEALASQLEALGAGAGPLAGPTGEASSSTPSNPSEPQRVMARSDGRKKIHTTFPDGSEMVEEFDERTDVLLLRKTRQSTTLGREAEWKFEVGQAPDAGFDRHSDLMRASASSPVFLRKDTPEHLQWRIRNLTYPADVYSVTVDHEKQDIVVRTSNKKYFKRISVPDLGRVGLKLKDELLSWKHQHNTLIISYSKPLEVIKEEQRTIQEAEKKAVKF